MSNIRAADLSDAGEQAPAFGVRPTALHDFGLETATRHLVETWDERSNLQFGLHLALNDRKLDPAVETTL